MKYLNHIDLSKNELRNAVIQPLASAPSSPVEGQIYYDTGDDTIYVWDGAAWLDLGGNGTGVVESVVAGNNIDVDNTDPANPVVAVETLTVADISDLTASATELNVLDGIPAGLTATEIGYSDGVTSAIQTQLDAKSTASKSEVLTNKTIDANGTGNSLSNIEVADFAGSAIVTAGEGLASSDNDTSIPTTAAVIDAVAAAVGAADAMVFKGALDGSSNPNYPAAVTGDTYKVSVAGKVGGASGVNVEIGDLVIASADNAGGTQASVGASWFIVQSNLEAATTALAGFVELATAGEAEARTDTGRAVTPVALANFPVKKIFTIGDGAETEYELTHNLGTKEVITQVRQASDDAVVECDIANTSTTVVTLTFAVAPSTDAIKAVVLG